MYFIGVDCSTIKTMMMLGDNSGNIIRTISAEPAMYAERSMPEVISTLDMALQSLVKDTTISTTQCAAAFCMACAEHNLSLDTQFERLMSNRFECFTLTSDAISAYNAVFNGVNGAGVVLVANTGSIAYGQDCDGNMARCGGYGDFASDDGSTVWLGAETISLFYRQSDGRLPKGALHMLLCQQLQIHDSFGMLALVERRFSKDKYATAQLHSVLLQAAAMGDMDAKRIFKKAAHRLAAMANGVRRQLGIAPSIRMQVSYTGSVFFVGEVILVPLEQALTALNLDLVAPHSNMLVEGSLKLALKFKR